MMVGGWFSDSENYVGEWKEATNNIMFEGGWW